MQARANERSIIMSQILSFEVTTFEFVSASAKSIENQEAKLCSDTGNSL